ncbi:MULTISPECIES: effector-associated constant component EACC1 [Streptomyces]|uniref:BON domain-containing protein n=1 Tax=Streptomyces dengpaensis TaxID=2049881 RepID=A0ABM6SLH1_9ACTN|nr:MULTISPECIES: hypothetical protein [Streptomyces]AVH55206.1 hypothetical protein C4B68_04705 [Streptomyces dengpaensis]PIB07424.1 hypothetical protein B1C81_20120 [Streptomyces sp. HG99]
MPEMIFGFGGNDAQEIADEVQSLAEWFDETQTVRQADITRVKGRIPSGRQGLLDETLRYFSESDPVVAAGVTAYFTWLYQRIKTKTVKVSITCPNGVVISGTAKTSDDVSTIKERLRRDCQV